VSFIETHVEAMAVERASVLIDGFTLTEAPRWRDMRLWFCDMYDDRVCSITETGSDLRVEAATPGIPSGLGWLPDGRLLVVVQNRQRIVRREEDGSLVEHADLSRNTAGPPNDLTVTAAGTAFVGSFGFDLHAGESVKPSRLMRITPDGKVSNVGDPLYFANGLTIIDGRTLVIAESFGNRLSAFDILEDDQPSERRDWATFGPLPSATDLQERFGELVVAPDGISSVDAEGAIWVADFTKTVASRVLPGGEIAQQVSTGDLNCFAAALGGADGRTLFLCAAPDELDSNVHRANPRAAIMAHRVAVPAA
jgi:sugar lactone lactonase YvrE